MSTPATRPTLSIAIITLNEERRIARCLASLQFSAKTFRGVEIVLVDAESRDNTVGIARRFGARTFVRPWNGYGEQRNYALSQCTGDWIFMLDADEVLTPELIAEIEREVPVLSPDVHGCHIQWHDFYLGKWMRHGGWSPYQLRLVRRSAVHCTTVPVHEGLRVTGRVTQLREAVNHYSYDSIRDCIDKADRYSSLNVPKLSDRERRHWRYHLVAAPVIGFFQMYIRRRGFLDGWHGFVASVMAAFHDFLVYAKLWEQHIADRLTDPRL